MPGLRLVSRFLILNYSGPSRIDLFQLVQRNIHFDVLIFEAAYRSPPS
jgi:hypothetical protein